MTGGLDKPQVSKGSPETMRKLILFLAVGGAFAVAYSILGTVLVEVFPGHPLIISIGVHAFLIPFAFFSQRTITFASSGVILHEFLRYAALQIVSISFSALTLSQFVGPSGVMNLLVFLSISALSAILSFAICNFHIFRAPDPGGTSEHRENREGGPD